MGDDELTTIARTGLALLSIGIFVLLPCKQSLAMHGPAHDSKSVLILDSTVTGGATSLEAVRAALIPADPADPTGEKLTVEVTDATGWGARTTSDFSTYRAVILGDPNCSVNTSPIDAATANNTVWGPAINGNVIVIGTDPVHHSISGPGGVQGGRQLTQSGIQFAAAEPTKTGAYITLSCYYARAGVATPVPLLDPFGSFTVLGQFNFSSCPMNSHIVAVHPALSALTDAALSNWGCSAHEAFDSFPSDFLVLVISSEISQTFTAPDGTVGGPYILARGETLSPILCGNGTLDPGEECDDGNTANGDGCSAQCKIQEITNHQPNAMCKNVTVTTDPGGCTAASASVNNGSSDPDGDVITLTQTPSGQYRKGTTNVTLTATDSHGTAAFCTADVTVLDQEAPSITCPAPQIVECAGPGGATATFSAGAGDNCGIASTSCPASGSTFPLGTRSVSCSATDGSGNSNSCNSSVTVRDTTAPTVYCVPVPRVRKWHHDEDRDDEKGKLKQGLFRVSASDICSAYTITLGGTVLVDGEIIKIKPTARPGIRLVGRDDDDDDRAPSIRRFRVGPGEAVITATDAAGNIGSVACPLPQRQGDNDDDDRHDSTEK